MRLVLEAQLFCYLLVALCSATEPTIANCGNPVWSFDAVGDVSWARNSSSPGLIDASRAGVTFLDDGTLLVYQVKVAEDQLSSRQDPQLSSPYRLQLFVFDIHARKKLTSLELGTRIHNTSVQSTSTGIAVQTGNTLALYSKQLSKVQEVTLSNPNQNDTDIVTVSASGRTILTNTHNESSSHFHVLDGTTLETRTEWNESPPLRRLYSISDTGIAAADFNQERALFEEFGTSRWRVLIGKPNFRCVGLPTLITDGSLAIACKYFSYLSTAGRLVFQDGFGKREALENKVAVARNGLEAAVSINEWRGSDFWDTGKGSQNIAKSVIVYDLVQGKRVLVFELRPQPKSDLDYAISPEGSEVAILSDRRVTICDLPKQ